MKFYELPEILEQDIQKFDEQIKGYQAGDINAIQFKGIRVAHGIYEQRKPETHMVRIRCAAGGITTEQLRHVGKLAKKYGSGEIHVTTRQEMQLHYVDLDNVIPVYESLKEVGLSSRGGGGNTIRNILSSHDAGVAKDELFDVTPYAMELTTRMIAEADSWNLPRKFKIAFSNTDHDNSRASVTCLGFIAKVQDGQKGFKVYCAGGQGSKPMLGQVLFDFVEDSKVYAITKAMKVMFDKYGNRRQRTKSKLKFLWDKLGKDDFLEKFHVEYDGLAKDASIELNLPVLKNEAQVKSGLVAEAANKPEQFELWKKRFVTEQKQDGLCSIMVPLQLGDIDGDEAGVLADALEPFGENILRLSVDQNMHFRNIPQEFLGHIFNIIGEMESLSQDPALFGNMVACTGADTCKLGICLPRGVTPSIQDILRDSDLDLDALSHVKIHISGCPNTCGCHHVADLGFFGKVMKQGKDMMPGYNVLAGAITLDGSARFSLKVDEISAKDLPQFIRQFLAVYIGKKDQYATFADYIDAEGKDDIKQVCDHFRTLPSLTDNQSYYYDWGSDEQFSLLKGQKAECSAGMFDMIDVDNGLIKEALKQYEAAEDDTVRKETLYRMIFSSSRMLLVTRGIECKSDEEVFENFIQHFIKTDLVSDSFTEIVLKAKHKDADALLAGQDTVNELAVTMRELYKSMDDSLRFRDKDGQILGEASNVEGNANELPEKKEDDTSAERFKDLRGVGCPMNFVKVKIELSKMASGEKIAVLLDDGAPVENVPGSVKNEGHDVVALEQQGEHWMLVVRKN